MENNELWIELMPIVKADGASLEISKAYPKKCFLESESLLPLNSEVKLNGRITNLSGSLILKATLDFSLLLSCDRCCDEYEESYHLDFSDVIAREGSEYEEGEFIPYSGNKVDLTEAIFKTIFPLTLDKHLCNPNCKGLCPICGGNLNERECGCKDEEIDPRLEKLKDFFKN